MKRVVRHTIDFLLFSNCWVALCVAGLVIGFAHYYCITDCYLYGTFAFLGTFATYNFHRLVRNKAFERAAVTTERSRWLDRNRTIVIVASLFGSVVAGIIFFFLPIVPLSLFLLGGTAFIVGFYAVPIPGLNRALRDLPGLKNCWIVLVWIVLVAIPPVNREKYIEWMDLVHIGLFTFIQIIPFDIRDMAYDSSRMQTLPQRLGMFRTRLLTTVLTLLLAGSIVLHHGFQLIVLLPVALSLAGLWWKQRAENLAALELVWDGVLLALGIFYYSLPCLHS